MRHAIVRFKYRREQWWADVFARLMAELLTREAPWFEEFDLLVPTPSYLGPGARRRWDPVGEIVARLASLVAPAWEVGAGVVVKRHETPAMQGRPWSARQAIAQGPLRDALVVTAPRLVAGARLLVVDDVMTGGSTLREVARALRAAGAAEVAGLVLARPPWHSPGSPSWRPSPGDRGPAIRSAGA
jgi:predicted amidophosphoribosyltransferase